jgi:uncharacterized cupin superfamily protein
MIKPVINIADVELQPRDVAYPVTASGGAAESYDSLTGRIGTRIGAQQLGYNITVVPPGKRALPVHSHLVNEEMFFVLAGTGEVRIGESSYPLRTGDIVACPAGGPETAHQIVNTGTETLRYLAVSTNRSPEVCEYPRSGKFCVFAEMPGHASGEPRVIHYFGREQDSLPYWDGE